MNSAPAMMPTPRQDLVEPTGPVVPAGQRGWANLISYAHTVCQLRQDDGGADPVIDIGRQVQCDYPVMGLGDAGLFTNLAAAAYCPSVLRHNGWGALGEPSYRLPAVG